jgi:hypothetical protein
MSNLKEKKLKGYFENFKKKKGCWHQTRGLLTTHAT